jgi:hypothetical protein
MTDEELRVLARAKEGESVLDAVIRELWTHGHGTEAAIAAQLAGEYCPLVASLNGCVSFVLDLPDFHSMLRRRLRDPALLEPVLVEARTRQDYNRIWPDETPEFVDAMMLRMNSRYGTPENGL